MLKKNFRWPEGIGQAAAMQARDRKGIRIVPLNRTPQIVAGVDAVFSGERVFAAACLYQYPGLEFLEQAIAERKTSFPYIPGYLFFREGPAIIAAVARLSIQPDVILVDAQGIAHPREIGSASHLGVTLGIPTIGCAKTRLIGSYVDPEEEKGSFSELIAGDLCVGAVLRTQDRRKPLFVSPGHLIDLPGAIEIILGCAGKYRIPEPLRCADILSRKARADR